MSEQPTTLTPDAEALHRRARPALELRKLAVDAFVEGYIAGLEATVAEAYTNDYSSAQRAWEASDVLRTLSEPGAEYIWHFGADGVLHQALEALWQEADGLRDAIRELLAVDGGDGDYDAVRFRAARDRCRELVKGDAT